MVSFAESVPFSPPASHLLAGGFALGFLAILLLNSWRGYWRGPIRCLAPLIAFLFAGTLAWFYGSELGFLFLGKLGIPWIFRGLFGILLTGILVWLPVFSLLWMWGRKQVSERTGEPEYPIFGATVGCWIGGFWVLVCVLLVSAAGTLGGILGGNLREDSKGLRTVLCRSAISLQKSVALIPGFYFVEAWNPLPEAVVRKINKLVAVLSNPDLARNFIYTNEVQSVLSLPAVYPVVNSPKIQLMLATRDVDGILADPDVNRMLDDEDFRYALSEINFERLLDEILDGSVHARER